MDNRGDRIIQRFDYGRLVKQTTIPIIQVLLHPDDYLDKYVARVYDLQRPTNLVAVADTYEALLAAIPTGQMIRLERDPRDDPAIIETWV